MVKYICPNLTKNGLEIDVSLIKEKFGDKGYKSLLKKFSIRYRAPVGTYYIEKPIYKFRKDKKYIYFPRFSTEALIKAGIISKPNVSLPVGDYLNIEFIGEPTENQAVVANHVMNTYFSNDYKKNIGCCGVTVCMLAGGGKTFLAMYIMSLLKKKTLIIVPNTYLLNQWKELLHEFMPNMKIGVYYGKEKKDGDIVIAIVNSLSKEFIQFKKEQMETEVYCSKFGFAILDESHIYCTDSFSSIYKNIQSTFMLGLSATPNERVDGTDKISHLNVGEVIYCKDINGYVSEDNNFNSNVKIIKYTGPPEYSENRVLESSGMISVPLMLEDLISDPYRNELIITEILNLLETKEDINIFVFSDRRAHCEMLELELAFRLKKSGLVNISESKSEDCIEIACTMYGGCSTEIVEKAKYTASVIFTTYAYSSTGVSIDKLNGLVLATPRKSKARQILGRVFRNKQEFLHKERMIVDICDVNSCLKQQLYGRLPAYKERNSNIIRTEVRFSDIQLQKKII